MWNEFKERLRFFGAIFGALLIDAFFFSGWVLIDYLTTHLIAIWTVEGVPLYIQLPKFALDFVPPVMITVYASVDCFKSLRKMYYLLVESMKKDKRDKLRGKPDEHVVKKEKKNDQ